MKIVCQLRVRYDSRDSKNSDSETRKVMRKCIFDQKNETEKQGQTAVYQHI